MLTIALILQSVDYFYHRKDTEHILISSSITFEELRSIFVKLTCKRYDNIVGLFPWVWTYLYIASAGIIFYLTNSWALKFLLILFVSGRIRTLQEIGHFAIHGSLCPNRKIGIFLSNILYQYPAFMPSAQERRIIHCKVHHRSVNTKDDPDLIELMDKGFVPGITRNQFLQGVLYPLTFRGIFRRFLECSSYLVGAKYSTEYFMRMASIVILVSGLLYFKL